MRMPVPIEVTYTFIGTPARLPACRWARPHLQDAGIDTSMAAIRVSAQAVRARCSWRQDG
ncbi:hypothetical protein C7E18_22665 [Stenotrophomonas maltophilia]|nr:hypothetical protein C7E18_22665 [Stenotrophomonas maltophilia]